MSNFKCKVAMAVAVLAVIVAGCSKQSSESKGPTSGPVSNAVSNPSDFPLYRPSKVVSVAPFDTGKLIDAMIHSEAGKSMRPGETPPPPVLGSEVLAATPATLAELRSWVKQLASSPPKGLVLQKESVQHDESARQFMDTFGYDGLAFHSSDNKRGVAVLVLDPKKVHEKLGVVFDLIDKYQALPAALRTSIDEQAKKQVGFTVTDMLDKSSPLGLVITATKELSSTNERAIVLIDGSTK